MIKKELVVYVETTEKDEFVKVNAIETSPGYFLLSIGQVRLPVNGAELIEAMSAIDYYATMFKQEQLAKQNRKAAPAKAAVVAPAPPTKGKKKANTEDEGAIVIDPILRMGPTASELALERQTQHMKGETIVITEKK